MFANETATSFDISKVHTQIFECLGKLKCEGTNSPLLTLVGEIVSTKISDSNMWSNVKIDDYQISCVYWRVNNLSKAIYDEIRGLKPGDMVKISGMFSISKKNLNIMFNVKAMCKAGKGEYINMFEQNKIKLLTLKKEPGTRTRTQNIFPTNIGIITSSTGAAICDIRQVFEVDGFVGNVVVKNTIVQGTKCPCSIINGIEWFERFYAGQLDFLLITRGGGSFEDLVGFSNWDVCVRIINCSFRTISAVGHQSDSLLTDFACDNFFPTPSVGAKHIVELQKSFINKLGLMKDKIKMLEEQYMKAKKVFVDITTNYKSTIQKFDQNNMRYKIRLFREKINSLVSNYCEVKTMFYDKMVRYKPTIYKVRGLGVNTMLSRKNELLTIDDFDVSTSEKMKKIEICLVGGSVLLKYRVISYEYTNG